MSSSPRSGTSGALFQLGRSSVLLVPLLAAALGPGGAAAAGALSVRTGACLGAAWTGWA
jgi:hypothetical protein